MRFFDTHTHFDYLVRQTDEPVAQLVQKALQSAVEKILIVGVQSQDFVNIEKLTALYPKILYYGLGLHPLYIQKHRQSDLDLLEKKLAYNNPSCIAVAEIGLERHYPELLRDQLWKKQCDFFTTQLQLAKQFQLPVSIHSRQAHDQLFGFLKVANLSRCGVIHGFSGSYQQAKRFIDLGYKIGVGGTITYQRANKTRNTIAKLPLDALILETDSPDMPINGFQGQPNRPERIRQIFTALCSIRSEPSTQILQVIWQNSCRLFLLDQD